MLGVVGGTDESMPFSWRIAYGAGAVVALSALWRWGRSHCLIDSEGVTVVGIVRKRRFPADRVIGAEVEPGGCLRWHSQAAEA